MIRNGDYVADALRLHDDDPVTADRIQPNGVDLTVDKIHRVRGTATFENDGDLYEKPDRMKMEPTLRGDSLYYRLYSGQYAIVYNETVAIPEGHVGRVYPRSRVMRSGMHLTSALWDQGYEGRGEGLLRVPVSINYVDIEQDASLAQMVMEHAEDADGYQGSHQGERL